MFDDPYESSRAIVNPEKEAEKADKKDEAAKPIEANTIQLVLD
jgi:hypothetical protein